MKKRQNISIYPLLIIVIFLVFTSSCEKDDENKPTNGQTTAVFNTNVSYGTMTDQDGNVYKTVTIGTQTWMAENLRTTTYNDGTSIPNITDKDEWAVLTKGGYCNYNNATSTDTIATYGRLYNWYAVNTGKLAPEGWHVPTDGEWKELEMYLGMSQSEADDTGYRGTDEGGKLKETGTTHWNSPNTGATNASGFTAVPGGYRYGGNGSFRSIGNAGAWWSATERTASYAWYRGMGFIDGTVGRNGSGKQDGISVRCLRD